MPSRTTYVEQANHGASSPDLPAAGPHSVDLSVNPEDEWASLLISMKVFGTASAASRPSSRLAQAASEAVVNRL
jgi:hypothetical protein